MYHNKGGMIPKVVEKNEKEKIERAEKALEMLRRQARLERLMTSQTGGDLLAYTNEHLEEDALANPEKFAKKNPFRTNDPSAKKSMCTIL